jgi:hypothetical protein
VQDNGLLAQGQFLVILSSEIHVGFGLSVHTSVCSGNQVDGWRHCESGSVVCLSINMIETSIFVSFMSMIDLYFSNYQTSGIGDFIAISASVSATVYRSLIIGIGYRIA